MSPSVGNFVHDLVEMAKAMETLPQVQMELERMREQHIEDGNRIVRLETRLMDRASEIESLNARIRSLEVERDDASFRQLEAEDKVASVGREIGAMQDILRGIDLTINPPKPHVDDFGNTVPQDQPLRKAPWAWSVAEGCWKDTTPVPAPEPISGTVQHFESVGESVSSPTVSSQEVNTNSLSPVDTPTVEPVLDVGMPDIVSRPADQPYLGKNYIDIPRYVSYTDWVAGGGTYDGYWHGRGGFQAVNS